MSVSNTPINQESPLNFEQAYAELENIVAQMEAEQLPLEAALTAYKRGSFLLKYCQNALAEVEQQVQILNERNQLMPFDNEND
ncbi:MAG: exodeoxyribonuclease VII small subunit [Methylotenera sp.]|nr:MAG: exodeoxyribonuclease VII small subunit [Methylotenera sp.]